MPQPMLKLYPLLVATRSNRWPNAKRSGRMMGIPSYSKPELDLSLGFAADETRNSPEVLGLYRKRPLRGSMNHIGVCGRFRYSDLKEAARYGI